MRLAYADPPYPGRAHLYPENEEVDHVALLERLATYDGWALSTWEPALRDLLPLAPAGVRVLAWCRPNAPPFGAYPSRSWEPVLLKPARDVAPHGRVRDYLEAFVPQGFVRRSAPITGQKPRAFCEWIIRALGASKADDELDDLYPGTGIMGETWSTWRAQLELTPPDRRDVLATRRLREASHVGELAPS